MIQECKCSVKLGCLVSSSLLYGSSAIIGMYVIGCVGNLIDSSASVPSFGDVNQCGKMSIVTALDACYSSSLVVDLIFDLI